MNKIKLYKIINIDNGVLTSYDSNGDWQTISDEELKELEDFVVNFNANFSGMNGYYYNLVISTDITAPSKQLEKDLSDVRKILEERLEIQKRYEKQKNLAEKKKRENQEARKRKQLEKLKRELGISDDPSEYVR